MKKFEINRVKKKSIFDILGDSESVCKSDIDYILYSPDHDPDLAERNKKEVKKAFEILKKDKDCVVEIHLSKSTILKNMYDSWHEYERKKDGQDNLYEEEIFDERKGLFIVNFKSSSEMDENSDNKKYPQKKKKHFGSKSCSNWDM